MARILDLGCGTGNLPVALQVDHNDEVVGVDINEERIAVARQLHPGRRFECARGESLPFADGSFDRVVSSVALPYMNIPKTLAEVRRVLAAGGEVRFSLHPPSFTVAELRTCRTLVPALYRLYVLLNGLLFHFSGRTLHIGSRCESFQTEHGMKLALNRAGFSGVVFLRLEGKLELRARGPMPVREGTPALLPAIAN